MSNITYEVEALNKRETFNKVVGHIKSSIEIMERFESYENVADTMNQLLAEGRMASTQIIPILSAMLLDKYGYIADSHNLSRTIDAFADLAKEVAQWNAVDIIVVYFHPELGVKLINPKRPEQWEAVQALKKTELVTVYVGTMKDKSDSALQQAALARFLAVLDGKKGAAPASLKKGKFKLQPVKAPRKPAAAPRPAARKRAVRGAGRTPAYPSAAPAEAAFPRATAAPAAPAPAAPAPAPAAAPTGQRKMTPMYSIPVTNELFHNGNVEAWKKIILSYTTKYPDCAVYVFYEGERIHDINTLFKWGKVKHGSSILISVAGETITDVAKLQRYLKQGASHQFEAFLKFPVNQILNLF